MRYNSLMKLTLFVALLLTSLALADPVARVQEINGPGKLEVKEQAAKQWHRAHLEMDASIGDNLRTTDDTLASLRFFLGGRANLDKGSQIEISSERGIKVVEVKSGSFWAKFDKQKEQPVKIRTAGGVMGIRGTEFVVQVEGDETILSLLEGDVLVEPAEGEPYTARPGSKIEFGRGRSLRATLMETEETLRETFLELRRSRPELQSLRGELRAALSNPEVKALLIQEARARRGQRKLLDPRETLADEGVLLEDVLDAQLGQEMRRLRGELFRARKELRAAAVEVKKARREARRGAREARRGAREARRGAREARQALLEAGLLTGPAEAELDKLGGEELQVGPHPKLEWNGLEGDRFAVMILSEEGEMVWLETTSGNSYQYPTDAAPLPPGPYTYRVVPVNAAGEYLRAGLEYDFEVSSQ